MNKYDEVGDASKPDTRFLVDVHVHDSVLK